MPLRFLRPIKWALWGALGASERFGKWAEVGQLVPQFDLARPSFPKRPEIGPLKRIGRTSKPLPGIGEVGHFSGVIFVVIHWGAFVPEAGAIDDPVVEFIEGLFDQAFKGLLRRKLRIGLHQRGDIFGSGKLYLAE